VSIAAGVLIATLFGPVRVDDLVPGSLVLTRAAGPQPVLALARETLRPGRRSDALVMIRPHALGRGAPGRSMIVTPGQAVMTPDGPRAADALVDGRTVLRVWPQKPVTMVSPVLAAVHAITANNLFLGTPRLRPETVARLAGHLPPPDPRLAGLIAPARSG